MVQNDADPDILDDEANGDEPDEGAIDWVGLLRNVCSLPPDGCVL